MVLWDSVVRLRDCLRGLAPHPARSRPPMPLKALDPATIRVLARCLLGTCAAPRSAFGISADESKFKVIAALEIASDERLGEPAKAEGFSFSVPGPGDPWRSTQKTCVGSVDSRRL
ncbi:unnamed protein product [Durusdinium trenchii]|uniref:Uncharacterized protein n=2 Tax=Durusdinium trenchii TaxID=1381693 RepID=A0ABP0QMD8_9DINO